MDEIKLLEFRINDSEKKITKILIDLSNRLSIIEDKLDDYSQSEEEVVRTSRLQ